MNKAFLALEEKIKQELESPTNNKRWKLEEGCSSSSKPTNGRTKSYKQKIHMLLLSSIHMQNQREKNIKNYIVCKLETCEHNKRLYWIAIMHGRKGQEMGVRKKMR